MCWKYSSNCAPTRTPKYHLFFLSSHIYPDSHTFITHQQNASRVATPSFGSSHKEGPWPECRGMDGDACCKLIESYATDVQGHCHVISEGSAVTMDFRTDRVRVVVDDQNIVVQIPNRG
jgi:Potato inhibitor I family